MHRISRMFGDDVARACHHAAATALVAGLLLLSMTGSAAAAVLVSQEEALALAFPGAQVQRLTAYLDEEQLAQARELAGRGIEVSKAMVPYYVALKEGEPAGVAYFDTHLVRTEAATVMYVVSPESRLERVEIIAFNEPRDYLPRQAWLDQFAGRPLDEELKVQRGIRSMTGATLTARSLTAGARRILALHAVIAPGADADAEDATPAERGQKP